jgi:CO dehydrogenase/acetyl-CoA synthase gamma subunit (corrinoid Fe-S protein)
MVRTAIATYYFVMLWIAMQILTPGLIAPANQEIQRATGWDLPSMGKDSSQMQPPTPKE